VPTQQKWRNSKRRETQGVENFIKSIKYVENKMDKKVLFGVWSSKIRPFEDNEMRLRDWNVICVSHFTDVDVLVKKTVDVVEATLVEKIGKLNKKK
jgi:hypothetical protein